MTRVHTPLFCVKYSDGSVATVWFVPPEAAFDSWTVTFPDVDVSATIVQPVA